MGKKHQKHEEHVNHERWLVSYADFITLLFAFFVVLFSSSQVDRSKSNKMALAIQAAFSKFALFNEGGGMSLTSIGGEGNVSSTKTQMITIDDGDPIFMAPEVDESDSQIVIKNTGDAELNQGSGQQVNQDVALARANRDIVKMLDKNKVQGAVTVDWGKKGIRLSLREAALFDSGQMKLTPLSVQLLSGMGGLLESMSNKIHVEGHTDSKPADGAFPSNWELSTARASYVVRWLTDHYNIDPKRFAAIGYGPYQPVADNSTEVGRLKNRRVDIVILSHQKPAKKNLSADLEREQHW